MTEQKIKVIGAGSMAHMLAYHLHAQKAIADTPMVMLESEKPKPIEPSEFESYGTKSHYPLCNPHVDDVIHTSPFNHPKRTRKSQPLRIGSYKQKRK
jgi:hypothetical protein